MIPITPPSTPTVEWSEGRLEIPCMNVDCEWVQHMELFYPSYDLFLLPGMAPNGYCIVCQEFNHGRLNRSEIKLSDSNSISIL